MNGRNSSVVPQNRQHLYDRLPTLSPYSVSYKTIVKEGEESAEEITIHAFQFPRNENSLQNMRVFFDSRFVNADHFHSLTYVHKYN